MKFNNKKVVLTGAGSGMGREIALELLRRGATVAALDINADALKETKKLANDNEKLSLHIVNIADEGSLNKFYEEYHQLYNEVDVLINNAGIIQPFVHFKDLDDEAIDRVMNVNFFGLIKLTKLFLPDLLKRPEAHIINVSSMGGFFPFPGQTIYGASKAAVKLFTEGLYAELLDTNVHVTLVLPGAIATNIMQNSHVEMDNKNSENSGIKMLSAVEAAKQILDGTEKNKFKLYIGKDSKMMNIMYKINDKAAIKMVQKKMKQ